MESTDDEAAFHAAVAPWRRELVAHCYQMCGSLSQETLLRAWQARGSFQGRSSVRRWLHRIATNAAIDALRLRKRRTLPALEGPAADPSLPMPPPSADQAWLEPFPDELLPDHAPGPEARYSARQSIGLAFVAAMHQLTPQQRAVLLLRDVLGYEASEAAEALGLTVAAVNGTLLRARAVLPGPEREPAGADVEAVVARYVDAFQRRDLPALVDGLYVQPWLGVSVWIPVAGEPTVAGRTFSEPPAVPFPALHLGYEF